MAFGMKVWVTPLRKAPRPTKVLTEGRSNTKLVVKDGSSNYQLRPCNQWHR